MTAKKKSPAKKAAAKKTPAKKAAKTPDLADPDKCMHPRASLKQFGWGTVCGQCGKRYR